MKILSRTCTNEMSSTQINIDIIGNFTPNRLVLNTRHSNINFFTFSTNDNKTKGHVYIIIKSKFSSVKSV